MKHGIFIIVVPVPKHHAMKIHGGIEIKLHAF